MGSAPPIGRCHKSQNCGSIGAWFAERRATRDNGTIIRDEREPQMAAMKPRTGDGPMEAVKEGRLIIVRVPLEGGGRLVVSVNDAEAKELHDVLAGAINPA